MNNFFLSICAVIICLSSIFTAVCEGYIAYECTKLGANDRESTYAAITRAKTSDNYSYVLREIEEHTRAIDKSLDRLPKEIPTTGAYDDDISKSLEKILDEVETIRYRIR